LKKQIFIAAAIIALLLPLLSFAQPDVRKSGLYAIVNGASIPLSSTYGVVSALGENRLGLEVTYQTYQYKGESSGTVADSTFVLVIDPAKKEVSRKMSGYDPFIKKMTPNKVIIVPLEVIHQSQCRVYYPGAKCNGLRFEQNTKIKFEATKISDNSFEIRTHTLPAGEYGFVFHPNTMDGFDFSAIFGFTVL